MDERTLPPGSLDAALEAMRAALGAENVLTDPEGMADHGDPFAPPGEQGHWMLQGWFS